MSKTTIRLLAVSAIALSAAFIGHQQASAFSFASSFMLAQAGGGAGSGAAGSPGGAPGTGSPPGAGPAGSGGGTASGASPGDTPTTGAPSPSMGVPAQCASITAAAERQACIDRERLKK
jgi:hypothetical protein